MLRRLAPILVCKGTCSGRSEAVQRVPIRRRIDMRCRVSSGYHAYDPWMAEGWLRSATTVAETEAEFVPSWLPAMPVSASSPYGRLASSGEVAERLKAADLKSARPFGVSGVRIPPSPVCPALPDIAKSCRIGCFSAFCWAFTFLKSSATPSVGMCHVLSGIALSGPLRAISRAAARYSVSCPRRPLFLRLGGRLAQIRQGLDRRLPVVYPDVAVSPDGQGRC